MSDIFISYKREEQAVARKLADALQKKGWSVWWDPKLRAGEHFDDAIERALNDAKCVIVIWSKLSVKSRYVKDEASYALKRKKLVPTAIEEVALPFRFEGIQTVHLIGWDGSESFIGFQKLVGDIVSILGEPPAEEQKRKQEQAERESKSKLREDEQRKADEEKQRLAENKQKANDEKRRKEEKDLKHKSEEEERKRKESEAKQKAEESEKRKVVKEEIKTDKPETVKIKPSDPRKRGNAIKLGVVAGIIVLLIIGGWFYYQTKQEQQKNETRIKLEQLNAQVMELARSVVKVENQEQIKRLYRQRDDLSHQVEGFSEQATEIGLQSPLVNLQNSLKQIQNKLANKEKELIAVRKGRIYVASAPDNAAVKILNIDGSFQQGMELKPGKYHVEVSSQGYEPQDRWIELVPGEEKRISFDLRKITAKDDKTIIRGKKVTVTNQLKLPLRAGQSTEHKIIALLTSGEGLELIEYGEDWSKVRTTNGLVGYTLMRYLKKNPGGSDENKLIVTDVIKIVLRTGPSTERKIIAVLTSGEELELIEYGEDWSKVRTSNGLVGYTLTRYLVEYSTAKPLTHPNK